MINVYGVHCQPFGSEYGDLYVVYADSEEEAILMTKLHINIGDDDEDINLISVMCYGEVVNCDDNLEQGVIDSLST